MASLGSETLNNLKQASESHQNGGEQLREVHATALLLLQSFQHAALPGGKTGRAGCGRRQSADLLSGIQEGTQDKRILRVAGQKVVYGGPILLHRIQIFF
jgi:hypothetical protein